MKNNFVAKNMNKINKSSIHKNKKYEDQFNIKLEDKEELDELSLDINKKDTSKTFDQ